MTRAVRLLRNAAFGAAFLAGLAFVWAGLGAIVLGGDGIARGFLDLAVGFGIWIVLALVGGRASTGTRIDGRS